MLFRERERLEAEARMLRKLARRKGCFGRSSCEVICLTMLFIVARHVARSD